MAENCYNAKDVCFFILMFAKRSTRCNKVQTVGDQLRNRHVHVILT